MHVSGGKQRDQKTHMPHGFPMGLPIGSLVAGPTGGCIVSSRNMVGRGFKPVTPQLDTIVTGWWFQPTPLKNMKVSWEDNIPNIWKVIKNVPNHQPDVDIMDIMTIFGGCV